jgi:hypothetical protein
MGNAVPDLPGLARVHGVQVHFRSSGMNTVRIGGHAHRSKRSLTVSSALSRSSPNWRCFKVRVSLTHFTCTKSRPNRAKLIATTKAVIRCCVIRAGKVGVSEKMPTEGNDV